MSYVSAEHDRMLAAMILPCVVVAVDLAAARVRVRSGDWTSGWLRWHSLAAGKVRHWRAPSIGEQGVLLSPSGGVSMGTFIPGCTAMRARRRTTAPAVRPGVSTTAPR